MKMQQHKLVVNEDVYVRRAKADVRRNSFTSPANFNIFVSGTRMNPIPEERQSKSNESFQTANILKNRQNPNYPKNHLHAIHPLKNQRNPGIL